ncbi:MAG: glycosyltransferase family 2 protein [Pseudomonadota bacterium]
MGKLGEQGAPLGVNAAPVSRNEPVSGARERQVPLFDYCAVQASMRLEFRAPNLSAYHSSLPVPPARVRATAGVLGCAGLLQPELFFHALVWLGFGVFAALVFWRAFLFLVATTPGFKRFLTLNIPKEVELPVYTVLVPLYREAPAVLGLAAAMSAMRWPQGRLDILLLLETGDTETQDAVFAAEWPMGTRVLIVPKGAPQTKPRALNYGLQYARGTLVCIYDAEDRPHPGQLLAAYSAFAQGAEETACVQAPLAAYNHRQSWIALHWSLEYAVQFGLLLPALARLRLPILLGGTSNHFKMSVLRTLGGWDAWNVTEDADLGVRLARRGYRSDLITLPTFEEAPETLGVWTAQRSRWLKGFLQTWAVMMRSPAEVIRTSGWPAYLALNAMLIGTCLAALVHGPLFLGLLIWVCFMDGAIAGPGLWLLVAGYAVNAIALLSAPGPKGMRRWLGAVTLPLYWPLHSLAALRALYGWVRTPHFWAKTPHGLTAHPG